MISNNLKPADAGQGTGASSGADEGSRARGASRRRERGSEFSATLRGLGADPSRGAADRGRASGVGHGADGTDRAGGPNGSASRRRKEAAGDLQADAPGLAGQAAAGSAGGRVGPTAREGSTLATAGRTLAGAEGEAGRSAMSTEELAARRAATGTVTSDAFAPTEVARDALATDTAAVNTIDREADRAARSGDVADAARRQREPRTVPGQALADATVDGTAIGRRREDAGIGDRPTIERLAADRASPDRASLDRASPDRAASDRAASDRGSSARAAAAEAASAVGAGASAVAVGALGAAAAAAGAMATATSTAAKPMTSIATGTASPDVAATGTRASSTLWTVADSGEERDEGNRRDVSTTTRRQSAFQARLTAADTPVSESRAAAGEASVRATSTVELASAEGSALRAVAERERAAGTAPQQVRAQDMAAHLPPTPSAGSPVASTVPTVTIAPALNDPAFAQALGQQVVLFVDGDIQVADMIVTPPDMGPVRIELSVRGDNADVVFTAAAPETLRAIEASGEVLRSMLAERGISLGSMDVGQGQAQSSGMAQGDGASHRQHASGRAETTGQGGGHAESTVHTPSATSHRRGIVDLIA